MTVLLLGLYFDRGTRPSVLHGVVEQVEHDLPKCGAVDVRVQILSHVERNSDVRGLGNRAECFDGICDLDCDRGALEIQRVAAGLETREPEHAFDECRESSRLGKYDCRKMSSLVGPALALERQRLGEHRDLREWSAKLVRHVGNEASAQICKLAASPLLRETDNGEHR